MRKVLYMDDKNGIILNDRELIVISGDKIVRFNGESLKELIELRVCMEDWELSDVDKERILINILDEYDKLRRI